MNVNVLGFMQKNATLTLKATNNLTICAKFSTMNGGPLDSHGLTPKLQQFADAYLGKARFNGTEAARIARYKGNDVTLGAVAYENLNKPQIISYLSKKFNEIAAKSEKEQINTYEENLDSMELLRELKASCIDWLRVNGKIDLDWRANECKVIYHDPREKTALKWPKQQKAKLQEIINQLESTGRIKVEVIQGPTMDLRKYILEVIDRIDACIDKFARFAGDYSKDKENPETVETALASFNLWLDKNPDASQDSKLDAIKSFASWGKVSEEKLRERAGVQVIDAVQ